MMIRRIISWVRHLMIQKIRIFDQDSILLVLVFFITMAFQARSIVEPLVVNCAFMRIVVAMFFSNVPSIVSLSMPKTCSFHNHIYVPVHHAFVDVGLSPISIRTIYRNLHACIGESESFCVQSCAFLIRWQSGKNIHNFHTGITFLSVHTYVWLDEMQAQRFGYKLHTSGNYAVDGV